MYIVIESLSILRTCILLHVITYVTLYWFPSTDKGFGMGIIPNTLYLQILTLLVAIKNAFTLIKVRKY